MGVCTGLGWPEVTAVTTLSSHLRAARAPSLFSGAHFPAVSHPSPREAGRKVRKGCRVGERAAQQGTVSHCVRAPRRFQAADPQTPALGLASWLPDLPQTTAPQSPLPCSHCACNTIPAQPRSQNLGSEPLTAPASASESESSEPSSATYF